MYFLQLKKVQERASVAFTLSIYKINTRANSCLVHTYLYPNEYYMQQTHSLGRIREHHFIKQVIRKVHGTHGFQKTFIPRDAKQHIYT